MAIELYTIGTETLTQPVVAQLWNSGVQQGADLAATATSATHFVASIPVTGVPRQLTHGYQIIWVDSAATPRKVAGGQVLWDGNNEVFRGSLAVDQSTGGFV